MAVAQFINILILHTIPSTGGRHFVWWLRDDVYASTRGKVSEIRYLPRETDGARNGNVGDGPSDTIAVSALALGGHHHFGRRAPVTREVGGDLLGEPGLEDLLVLGRDKDKVYFCNRRAGTFRLLSFAATAMSFSSLE